MFSFLCKSLGLGCSIRPSSSVHQELHCFLENPSILSCLRNISSVNSDDVKEHSFTVSYLMNICGFSLKPALEVSKQVHFETPDNADSVLEIFKNHGFSNAHILNLVRRWPRVLLCKPHRTLLPKLGFFHSKGFSSPDVVKIISTYPWILRISFENKLVPAFDFFENLLQSDAMAIKAVKLNPRLLDAGLEKAARIVDILLENGVPMKNIALSVRIKPGIMLSNLENFKRLVQKASLMGFHPSKSQFVVAIVLLRSMTTCTWEKKLDVYRRWGLSQEEILAAFVKNPWFMSLSEEKITAVMDLLSTNWAGSLPILPKTQLYHHIAWTKGLFQGLCYCNF